MASAEMLIGMPHSLPPLVSFIAAIESGIQFFSSSLSRLKSG